MFPDRCMMAAWTAGALVLPLARAQTGLYDATCAADIEALASLGDVDQDGVRDWILGCPDADTVEIESGADGSPLRTHTVVVGNVQYGAGVAGTQDHDGDLVDDYVIGAPSTSSFVAPFLELRSGATGALIRQIVGPMSSAEDFGRELAGADVTGDGLPELVTSQPFQSVGAGINGILYFYDGADGSLARTIEGDTVANYLGLQVESLGDLDMDGLDEVVAMSWGDNELHLYAGVDGSELLTIPHGASQFGVFSPTDLATVGDLNGDGRLDLAFGLSSDDTTGSASGRVRTYSGLDGGVLFDVVGKTGDYLGRSIANAGDVDGDGTPDLAIESLGGFSCFDGMRSLVVASGADGRVLHNLREPQDADSPVLVGSAGDVDGDGIADPALVLGATLRVYSGFQDCDASGLQDFEDLDQGLATDVNGDFIPDSCVSAGVPQGTAYCTAKTSTAGCVASMAGFGQPSASGATPFDVVTCAVQSFKPGIHFYGFGRAAIPLLGGTLCVQPPLKRLAIQFSGGAIDDPNACTGTYQTDMSAYAATTGAFQAGQLVHMQTWYRDPTGGGGNFNVAYSDGFEFTYGP